MFGRAIVAAATAAAIGLGGIAVPHTALAGNVFNMMNPFKWFDSDSDRDHWRGPYGRHGWGGPYGWSGPYGWGGPWGYPGYSRTNTVIVVPEANTSSQQASLDLPE